MSTTSFLNKKIADAAAITTDGLTSEAIEINDEKGFSAIAAISAIAGISGASLKWQVCNDEKKDVWVDISGSSQNITANGNLSWNLVDQFARYIRCVVVVGAGSFTLSLVVHAKK